MLKFDPAYMEGAAQRPDVRWVKERSYELLKLTGSSKALDIGCGPGADTIALSKRLGGAVQVVGVDHDPAMIAAADANALREGVHSVVKHQLATIENLPFADAWFDGARCERVLQHLTRKDGALALDEAIRVTRDGGRIVFVDTDWYSMSVHSLNPVVERRVIASLWRHWTNAGAARGLPELFASRGMQDVHVEAIVANLGCADVEYLCAPAALTAVHRGEIFLRDWLMFTQDLRLAQRKHSFQASVVMMLCVGMVPERHSLSSGPSNPRPDAHG
jgi:ubiquinone/menaquinone biosynthesis C-methylase UbiE